MDDLSSKNLAKVFMSEFPDSDVTTKSIELGDAIAQAVFVKIKDESYLQENWVEITNTVAIHFQSTFEDDFERWNLYLFFLFPNDSEVRNELKYTIENDTFSSRKIIESSEISIEVLIEKHIYNYLSLDSAEEIIIEPQSFEYNPIIWDTLKDKTIKKTNVLPDEQMKTYSELFDKLNKEI